MKAVITLIIHGADPLLPPNKSGFTPLTDAEREGHKPMINFLEEYEAIRGDLPMHQNLN